MGCLGLFSQCIPDCTIEGFLRAAAQLCTSLMLAPEEFRALSAGALGKGSRTETQNSTLYTGYDGVHAPPPPTCTRTIRVALACAMRAAPCGLLL